MEMIETERCPAEKHTIQTKDGYMLTIYRLPQMNAQRTNRKVILFMHGMLNELFKEIKSS